MKKVISLLIILTIMGCDLFAPKEDKKVDDNNTPDEVITTPEFSTFSHDYWGEIRAIEPATDSKTSPETWYEDSSFYHLWVNAFRDASTGSLSGDGIGDMVGIKEAIDEGYFEELGINAIWLSPFFKGNSPSFNLHLYDTTDHYSVQSRFGNVDDVKAVLDAAHARNIRVIFDYVPNHISSEHPWFKGSANKDGIHDDWFNWRSSRPANGWIGVNGESAWHYNSKRKEYYYGVFAYDVPDINYNNPDVKKAMTDALIFWLNLGFDGIRVDAVKYIYEDDISQINNSDNLEFFQEMRDVLDIYNSSGYSKMMIAENWTGEIVNLNYYGGTVSKPAFHMTLDFNGVYDVANTLYKNSYAPSIDSFLSAENNYPLVRLGAFLSNHDRAISRPASLYNHSVAKQRIAAIYNTFTTRIPFLYYGNEIGMSGEVYDGSDEILVRKDFNWDEVSESNQVGDYNSILEWYRAVGQIRQNYSDLLKETPTVENISTSGDITAYSFSDDSEALLVVINLSDVEESISIGSEWSALLGTNNLNIISPLTSRVYYKGSNPMDHFFDDGDNITYTVSLPDHDATFIRGLLGWNTGNSLAMASVGNNIWTVDQILSVGSYEFKFTSSASDWEMDHYPTVGNNLTFNITEAGTYRIVFDWNEPGNYSAILLD